MPALLRAETFAACYYPVLQAGLRVDLATVSGAAASLDWSGVEGGGPSSSSPPAASAVASPAARQARTLRADPSAAQLLAAPRPVAHVGGDRFDACVVLSPTGAWDLCKNAEVARVLKECADAGGAVGSVGWGAAALLEAGLLGPGVAATGISNADEDANGTAAAVPFLLESRLRCKGVVFSAPAPGHGGGVSAGASAAQALSAAPHVVAAGGGEGRHGVRQRGLCRRRGSRADPVADGRRAPVGRVKKRGRGGRERRRLEKAREREGKRRARVVAAGEHIKEKNVPFILLRSLVGNEEQNKGNNTQRER